jgi:hypothetical protein
MTIVCIRWLELQKCCLLLIRKKNRQCTYERNIEARSRNNCCRGKAIRITCSECVFVASVIRHAIAHVQCNHLWPDRLYRIFSYYLINGAIFWKTLLNLKCIFWFFMLLLSETFLIVRRIYLGNIMYVLYIGLHEKYQLYLWAFKGTWIFFIIFGKILEYQILLNLSSGSRVLPCGWTDRQIWKSK